MLNVLISFLLIHVFILGVFIPRCLEPGWGSSYVLLLHVTREFYSIRLICRNLYPIFSHVKKAYTANQNGVQLLFTCERITNQRSKGLCEPIRIVRRLHSNNFLDLAAFLAAAPPIFSCEGGGKL